MKKAAKVIDFTSSMPEVKLYTPGWHVLDAVSDRWHEAMQRWRRPQANTIK